ncbi:MAG: hypothetical protein ACRDM1_12200 [Gaiellaceae bacterium]
MRKWLDADWYRYLWHRRLPFQAKAVAVALLALLVLGGGYLAASRLTAAAGETGSDAFILQTTTVTKLVTVKEHGKTIVKRFPVVRTVRLRAKPVTVSHFQTVTTPQGVRTVPVTSVRYVPVTKTVARVVKHVVTNVVTRNGKTRTVVTNRPVTVPVTVQQTLPGQTETRSVTDTVVSTRPVTATVVSPPQTTTVNRTNETTTTVVVTSTETQTVTTTLPQDTTTALVTVTVSVPTVSVP